MYPRDYKYSKDHEWVKAEGDGFIIGITDFAQSELGDVVYVEMPEVGATFEADDQVGTIESVKAVAEVYTPIAGTVVAINEALDDDPEAVNRDPHGAGWLFRLKPALAGAADELMTAEVCEAFVRESEA